MIDRIRFWFWKHKINRHQKRMEKWSTPMTVHTLDPNGTGIIIFTYGLPDYMVSGNVADKLRNKLTPIFEERFPNYIVIFIPFYVKMTNILEEPNNE